MKELTLISLAPVVFLLNLLIPFLLLSVVGIMWMPFEEIISNIDWFGTYTVLCGLWWSILITYLYIQEIID